MKWITAFISITVIGIVSVWLMGYANNLSSYEGLPTVPCQDVTEPIVEYFDLHIRITIKGENYPLSPNIGHDYGRCLHDIYVDDSSGLVHVRANTKEQFNLGQFFDVWKKTFSSQQIFEYKVGKSYSLEVLVNGKPVTTYRKTPLSPDDVIEVVYK